MIGIVLHTACKKLCVAKEFIWEGPEGVESVDIFGKKVFRSRASLGWAGKRTWPSDRRQEALLLDVAAHDQLAVKLLHAGLLRHCANMC